MRFIHIADVHCSASRIKSVNLILDELIKRTEQKDIDCIFFCGDFWDSPVMNTEGSGFVSVLNKIDCLVKNTSVLFLYGTPEHEPSGSLEVFKHMGCIVPEVMNYTPINVNGSEVVPISQPRLSLIPNKVKDKSKYVQNLFKSIPEKKSNHRIVLYHGDIVGAENQNGTVVIDNGYAIKTSTLKNMKADYIACGHIHKPQQVMDNCWYSGSAIPKNFGETHFGSYRLVDI